MDYAKTLDEIKEYFANLIILQYRASKQNRAFVANIVDIMFANNLALQLRDGCFDVNKSVGKQLDLIGKWVGVDRFYNSYDLWQQYYFAMINYSNVRTELYEAYQGGFSEFSTFQTLNGGFLTYKQWQDVRVQRNKVGDEYFRQMIKLKIIGNSIEYTCKNIDDAIWQWSDGKVYTTWDTMKVKYHYDSSMLELMQLLIYKKLLLAPTGCIIETEVA